MTGPVKSGELRVVTRTRLTDQTADALREYILTARLAPGTRLPAETALADSLGVSRNVLRQAVASLEGLGMLRVTQGSGTYVADHADTDVFRQLAAWMAPETISEPDYLEVRAIWERGIYGLVMDRAGAADLDRLGELADAILDADDADEAATRHDKFHEALLRLTGNQFLVTMGTILHRFFWEFGYRDSAVRKPPSKRLLESHRSIVSMLRSGDQAAIERMIELHLTPRLSTDEKTSEE